MLVSFRELGFGSHDVDDEDYDDGKRIDSRTDVAADDRLKVIIITVRESQLQGRRRLAGMQESSHRSARRGVAERRCIRPTNASRDVRYLTQRAKLALSLLYIGIPAHVSRDIDL